MTAEASACKPLPTPTVRTLHGMAYDANDNATLIFGGRTASGVFLNDTWSFDVGTNTWTEVTASGPGTWIGI